MSDLAWPRKVDVRLPGKGNSNSHGARPVHLIITMMKWIRTSRLSIKDSLSRGQVRRKAPWDALSLAHSLILSLSRRHTHTNTLTLSLFLCFSLSLSLALSLSHTHTYTLSHSGAAQDGARRKKLPAGDCARLSTPEGRELRDPT